MSTYTPSYNDDEIDLRDLIITFIDNWKIIAASTLLSVASAFIFLMITTPSFTTELEYTYARDGLRSLNTVPGIHYSEDSVTSELSQRLSAYENFLRYIQEDENAKNILLLATNINEEEFESSARSIFGEKLFFSQPTEKDQIGALRFKHINPYYGAEFLNSYYHWSQREYRIILENRAERAITSTITQNERQMRAMIEAYQESTRSFVLRQNEADQVRLLQLYDRLEAEKTL
ncbi:Wzz/FepE/Etk N-terminal domain-containing protein [Halomonas sp. E19]|uniref:Wzz/FepE/Etk N-terminal domain-containing protein n=1 Tax=Halomonas sp. E19 TaxID=3397247 RepID=UPI0040345A63